MSKKVNIDGVDYNQEELTPEALSYIEAIRYLDNRELELSQMFESLKIAKNTNIANLKSKIIKIKTGIEFQGEFYMPKVTIDDFDFNTEDLCDEGKDELARLQLIELQLGKLKNELSVYKTARNAYARKLKEDLENLSKNS